MSRLWTLALVLVVVIGVLAIWAGLASRSRDAEQDRIQDRGVSSLCSTTGSC